MYSEFHKGANWDQLFTREIITKLSRKTGEFLWTSFSKTSSRGILIQYTASDWCENRPMNHKFRNFTNFIMWHYFRNGRNPGWLNSKLFSCEVIWLILDQNEAGVLGIIRYCIFHLVNNK